MNDSGERQQVATDRKMEVLSTKSKTTIRVGEMKTLNHTWGTIWKLAQNRQEWMTFVAALHASRHSVQ